MEQQPTQITSYPLDFLIIGAQKGGTTSLHEVLSLHPEIAMALGKERPFFDVDGQTDLDWRALWENAYGRQLAEILVGKATPQYLSDPDAAERIAKMFPKVKLVAILRDPVERTYSHFRMCVRRGLLSGDFDTHVENWLNPQALARARYLPHRDEHEADCCVVWSEYSRMLARYSAQFDREALLIVFTEDLAREPKPLFAEILRHVGADASWHSDLINARHHVGGEQKKVRLPAILRSLPGVRPLAQLGFSILSESLAYRFEMWNVRPSPDLLAEQFPSAKARLEDHFSEESDKLHAAFCVRAPW